MYVFLLALVIIVACIGIALRSSFEKRNEGNPADGFEIIEVPNK